MKKLSRNPSESEAICNRPAVEVSGSVSWKRRNPSESEAICNGNTDEIPADVASAS